MGLSFFQLIIILCIIGPMIHVLASSRSHGGAKLGWFMAVWFFPLIGYIVFLIVTQKVVDQSKIGQESS